VRYLDDDDGLLDDIVDLGLDEVEERRDAALGGPVHAHGNATNGADCAPHKLDVHLGRVLLELGQYILNVLVGRKAHDDIQLLQLDIRRVIVLAEEDANVLYTQRYRDSHGQPHRSDTKGKRDT
jgi:hypothetical protein